MVDREKVIKGLLCCAKWMDENDIDACNSCPYHGNYNDYDHGCIGEVNNDAVALLKKQETTFEKDGHHIMCKSCGVYWCDRDLEGDRYPKNFCPNCGKVVKWG